ncbi:MAG TPA: flagellar basal body L-ring protein [Rhodospirillaceae bacterium]|nr:flagellar basal body L-ring protein [Rhodospirillaceae bacterium]MAX62082.1 flagellar basal body L-ring protein [Rhodospirillaceae bacterium]MBB58052.1 flagellar basal body L-ring protein [Rhodospirillaceae bacterium]HAE03499.1 flagellar basal body L-ring protein [Rhodospirillaceae bacterium]HAJ22895.1 flagellar basal body L-ring protein [Rhodospirillaceae bacterium]
MNHPTRSPQARLRTLACLTLASALLVGCNTMERLAAVGQEPAMNPVANPTYDPNYQQVTMPMPKPVTASYMPNSLWRPGSRAFFKDLRASDIGDIVTVVIDIDENAQLDNSTTRTRNNSENVDIDSLLGYENALNSVLPEAVNPAALLAFDGQTNNSGGGAIDRQEAISVSVAAVVTQVLPNGNLVIQGRQETRVNYELRELQIAGVIRPQDISTANTVSYEKIAEARLAYGGRGQVSDFQQPRWGTQIMDVIMPF